MRTEKTRDLIVIKRQAGSSQSKRVGSQINLSAENPRLQLRRAIAAIAELAQPPRQIGEKEYRHRRIPGQLLFERQKRGAGAEIANAENLQPAPARVEIVRPLPQTLHAIDDEIEIVYRRE